MENVPPDSVFSHSVLGQDVASLQTSEAYYGLLNWDVQSSLVGVQEREIDQLCEWLAILFENATILSENPTYIPLLPVLLIRYPHWELPAANCDG